MKRLLICLILSLAATSFADDTHVGFDTDKIDRRVVVTETYEGSMAHACGIRSGDVILRIGNARITSPKDVVRLTSNKKVGDSVRVTVMRGDQTPTFIVVLVDEHTMREKSIQAAKTRKETSEKMFARQLEAESEALAKDPELANRLKTLIEEYEFMADTNATRLEKAIKCDQIAACYMKMRNKEEYKRWKNQALAHTARPPISGPPSWP